VVQGCGRSREVSHTIHLEGKGVKHFSDYRLGYLGPEFAWRKGSVNTTPEVLLMLSKAVSWELGGSSAQAMLFHRTYLTGPQLKD